MGLDGDGKAFGDQLDLCFDPRFAVFEGAPRSTVDPAQ
jgi:hypothetical protein